MKTHAAKDWFAMMFFQLLAAMEKSYKEENETEAGLLEFKLLLWDDYGRHQSVAVGELLRQIFNEAAFKAARTAQPNSAATQQ